MTELHSCNPPDAFVMTKPGNYSGQSLAIIMKRKERERAAGHGEFWWGIGESKGDAITHLLGIEPSPDVLFLAQTQCEAEPVADTVGVWTHYELGNRIIPLPRHVLMLRSTKKAGPYYALVCQSRDKFGVDRLGTIHTGEGDVPVDVENVK